MLQISNLHAGYAEKEVLQGVSCTVEAGKVLCVVGPNGCGKTTLFRTILGSIKPTQGQVRLQDKNINIISERQRAALVAYIPQQHTPVFQYTVQQVVLMGRAGHIGMFEAPRRRHIEAANNAMQTMGIAHQAGHSYTTLSGGQRQMVLLARALAQQADLLIMDEPAVGLDYANQQRLLQTISELAKKGRTIVFSSHDPSHPFMAADYALLMKNGKVVAFGPPESAITSQTLSRVYQTEMDVLHAHDRYGKKHTVCVAVDNL